MEIKMWHDLMLFIFFSYSYDCIITYLLLKTSNRLQYVSINNENSEYLPITCGILQGSILGPILFLIYINDSQFATKFAHLVLYADDMNLLYSHKSIKNIFHALNKDLSSLQEWFHANKLTVLNTLFFLLFSAFKQLDYRFFLQVF